MAGSTSVLPGLPATLYGVASTAGRLESLQTAEGKLCWDEEVFANKQSAVHRYCGAGHDVVVKRLVNADRIKEEHKAIGLLQRLGFEGFVPIQPLRTARGSCFVERRRAYFVMPLAGTDLVVHREAAIAGNPEQWADVAVAALACVARTLLRLWTSAGATYYDIKARNILAAFDLRYSPQPFGPDVVLLCDTGSINSRCATHHPPARLARDCRAATQAEGRHCAYALWGFACTLVELIDGNTVPSRIRAMRKAATATDSDGATDGAAANAPFELLEATLIRIVRSLEHAPAIQRRVARLANLLVGWIDDPPVQLRTILEEIGRA